MRWTSWVLKLPEGASVVQRELPARLRGPRPRRPTTTRRSGTVVEDAFLEWSVRERETFEDFLA